MELNKIYNMEHEVWRPVKGYEHCLEVSTYGRARRIAHQFIKRNGRKCSVKECLLVPNKTKKGYLLINAKGGKCAQLHRLVALTFIENPNSYPEVNHIDEDKSNNRVDNLEWCTHKQNSIHGTRCERIRRSMLAKHLRRMLVYRSDGKTFNGLTEAANSVCGSKGNIVNCIKGKIKSAYGYKWTYIR